MVWLVRVLVGQLAHTMMPYYMPFVQGAVVTGFREGTLPSPAAAAAAALKTKSSPLSSTASPIDGPTGIPCPTTFFRRYVEVLSSSSGGSEVSGALLACAMALNDDGMPRDWNYFLAFAFFRAGAILQGVYKRALQGNASATNALAVGRLADAVIGRAHIYAELHEADVRHRVPVVAPPLSKPAAVTPPVPPSPSPSGLLHKHPTPAAPPTVPPGRFAPPRHSHGSSGAAIIRHDERSIPPLSDRARRTLADVREFVHERILPQEERLLALAASLDPAAAVVVANGGEHATSAGLDTARFVANHASHRAAVAALQSEARKAGLWNLFLSCHADPERRFGPGFSNREYAPMAEEMGRSLVASEVFNCQAPDTGNMEILTMYGTEAQQRQWLQPLLDGSIRSCFAMTEPGVASSDATNMAASVSSAPGAVVLDGRKWWTSGALDPRCSLMIFMGKDDSATEDPAATSAQARARGDGSTRHARHSMILVPMRERAGAEITRGIRVERALPVLGFYDLPHGHAELTLDRVMVQPESEAVLLRRGKAFAIAQGRLGPGRVHHCMRLVGMAERAAELSARRAWARSAFGSELAHKDLVVAQAARSRAAIEQARLLTLQTAAAIDELGVRAARGHIALIKAVVPEATCAVLDAAIQVHGGAGVSPQDTPLAQMLAWARALRIADGPDDVHWLSVGKAELAQWRPDPTDSSSRA